MKTILMSAIALLFLFSNGYSQYTVNYAGSFNGTNSYISVANYTMLNPTSAITLEAWINPSFISPAGMAIIGKNFQSSYFLAIHPTGRVEFSPRGGGIFISRVSSVIKTGRWTHVAGTYNGSVTKIFIDGILDTSTTVITGPIGVNSDSLYIGADRVGTVPKLYFNGMLDNVRIWKEAVDDVILNAQRFLPLEVFTPSGIYANLLASFQLDNDAASHSGNGIMAGIPVNLDFVDYRDKAVNIMDYNNSLVLNGMTDHFTIINDPAYNATTGITIEVWIRRDTTGIQPAIQNIINKSGPPDLANYALWLTSNGSIGFSINSPTGPPPVVSQPLITNGQWNHIAATYNSATGFAIIYLNGKYMTSANFGNTPIQNQGHNLYVGGIGISAQSGNRFKGQIDGLRIWKHERTVNQIRDNRFRNISSGSDLTTLDFDKFTNSPHSYNQLIFATNVFAGFAHISSSHLGYDNELTSPILSGKSGGLDTTFTMNNKSFFIPDGNPAGIKDSIFISSNAAITNLKACVLLSHTFVHDVIIYLISPFGTKVELFFKRGGGGNDIMTIFSDDADSLASLSQNPDMPGITAPFSPGIKPSDPLSVFNGENQAGWWKMQFIDLLTGQIGYVHSWGISVTGSSFKTLNLTTLIQGFYNSTTNTMIRDTVRVFLRKSNPPYNFIDSAKSFPGPLGFSNYIFNNVPAGQSFYIVVRHRNSIETWSSAPRSFTTDTLAYNFASAASKAYGSNQIQIDESPVKFGIFSGDINQDGNVDVLDLSIGNNDAFNFVTGYVPSDVTGDNVTDALDQAIIFNNALNFVTRITPP